ncbi:MAG: hypothetical protein UW37_C0007G0031 [Candidatus Gottesmanbacteria bacterium GW2011_GWA2_44_17]|uniref:Uncharacterized protein n=1 Tax=Candidatus Gottesmanbacteria bacterium GW2011_GWA2_44_17 TaxID=1618444 RepID=A0A0G1HKK6_9BACT|nr:MAG: hypothetical protein UW37_C0007G0031 [Candidatus Gottesmanbacteria bacterium GW2011_GWA2_44_17]
MPKNTLENIEDTLRDVEGRAVYNFLAAKTQTPPLGQLRAAVYNALANNVGRRRITGV